MFGVLKVIKRRAALAFRSPSGILGVCIGVFVLIYIGKASYEALRGDVQEGEEYYINDEDYILEKISQITANEFQSDGESQGEYNINGKWNGKSVDQGLWQGVSDANDEMYVYSAFYDVNVRLIRTIAVANKYMIQSLECRFMNDGAAVIGRTPGEIKIIREAKEYPYSAAFVLCSLPSARDRNAELPKFVSVASTRFSKVSSTSNILEIQYPSPQPSTKFAVCVQPIYNEFDDVVTFVEWIEFHRSLGVERFTFYNISIGPTVSCVLQEYNNLSQGIEETALYIEVLPWGDPSDKIKSNVTIKQQIQLGALNDCIYRQRGFAQYVFNIDVDEFIIPHKDKDSSYDDLISRLDLLSGRRRIGLYKFRNAFFSPEYEISSVTGKSGVGEFVKAQQESPDMSDFHEMEDFQWSSMRKGVTAKLVTLRDTMRMAEPHSTNYRTKFICMPDRLVEAGIHNAWETLQGYGTLNVPPTIGLLHHYRTYQAVSIVEDVTAKNLSLQYDISSKVFDTLYALKDTCSIWKTA